MDTILFNDLRSCYLSLKAEVDSAVSEVLESGWYILGKQTAAFELEFAEFCKVPGCVGVASGTDAIALSLRACGVKQGDEVVTVAHTAVATVAAIRLVGATPVLVDIDPDTYTLNPEMLEAVITPATKAIVVVHIYGHPAEIFSIKEIAHRHGLWLIEDCAQAHGAILNGSPVGSFGDLASFSFYPTKNLGCLGDGGAVVGSNRNLLEKVRLLREYGWPSGKRYVSQIEGVNSRLDELQAAVLRTKLRHLNEQNEMRRSLARLYDQFLPASVVRPSEKPGCKHVYHLYVVRVHGRDSLREVLRANGVETGIHYPVPVHQQPAYQNGSVRCGELVVTEQYATEILSLPMYYTLTPTQVKYICEIITAAR